LRIEDRGNDRFWDKEGAEGGRRGAGRRRVRFGGMAKNASPIRKLLKIVAKSATGEAVGAGSVFARSHVSAAKRAQTDPETLEQHPASRARPGRYCDEREGP
jgi:hypothetical protein